MTQSNKLTLDAIVDGLLAGTLPTNLQVSDITEQLNTHSA